VKPLPFNMYIGMGIAAFLCIFYGLFPNTLYIYLPFETDYQPFTVYHFVEITQIAVLTFAGFWLYRKKLAGERIIALDFDWFYRKPAPFFRRIFVNAIDNLFDLTQKAVHTFAIRISGQFDNPMKWLNPFARKNHDAQTYSPPMDVVMAFVLLIVLILGLFMVI